MEITMKQWDKIWKIADKGIEKSVRLSLRIGFATGMVFAFAIVGVILFFRWWIH